MIKYSNAICNELPINIQDVTLELRKSNQFFCLDCGGRMSAHLQGKKAKHFKHINHIEHAPETYLHKAAKKAIILSYEHALRHQQPIYMDYYVDLTCNRHEKYLPNGCDLGRSIEKYNLVERFTELEYEKPFAGLIPDIRLISKDGKSIFIEVCVTHKCTQEKIRSGHRIIEITIKNENDIALLSDLKFSIQAQNIEFYNFQNKPVIGDFCGHRDKGCRTPVDYLAIFNDEKYELGVYSLEFALGPIFDAKKYLIRASGDADLYIRQRALLQLADAKNIEVKNCINCKFHKLIKSSYTVVNIKCQHYGKISPEDALNCRKFVCG